MFLNRPIISYLLCCLMLLGQAPAWFHVATCHSHASRGAGCTRTEASYKKSSSCSCAFHRSTEANSKASKREHGIPHQCPHDSDSCNLCQSLHSPCGVTWNWSATVEIGDLVMARHIFVEQLSGLSAVPIAQPRGPPCKPM